MSHRQVTTDTALGAAENKWLRGMVAGQLPHKMTFLQVRAHCNPGCYLYCCCESILGSRWKQAGDMTTCQLAGVAQAPGSVRRLRSDCAASEIDLQGVSPRACRQRCAIPRLP